MRAFAAALLPIAASQSAHAAENDPLVRHSACCLIAVSTLGKLEDPGAVMLSNFAVMFDAERFLARTHNQISQL